MQRRGFLALAAGLALPEIDASADQAASEQGSRLHASQILLASGHNLCAHPGVAMPALGASAQGHDFPDHGPAKIKRCQTIDQPGSYKLVNNLKAAGDCLVITTEGVTIDLGDFTLTGNGTGTRITGPKAQMGTIPGARTVVRNGDISNFARATNLNGTVEGMRVTSNGEGMTIWPAERVTG